MSKNLKRNRAEEAKSCLEEQSSTTTGLKHAKKYILKSLTNTVNQNCPEFVMLSKKATFEKLNEKLFDKIKDFGEQGFLLFSLVAFYPIFSKILSIKL